MRERNKQRVMQRIILSASELFKNQGYHSTTMDAIAEKAEISRGTLFHYFPSKEDLLLPWGQEIVEQQILSQLEEFLEQQPTVWQVFHFLFSKMSGMLREYPDVIQAVVREAVKSSHPGLPGWDKMERLEVFVQIIRYGQERGEIRKDIPLENLASYMSALQASLIFRMMVPSLERYQDLEIDRLMAFLQSGLAE